MCPYDQVEEIEGELPAVVEKTEDEDASDDDDDDDDDSGDDSDSDEDEDEEENEEPKESTPEEEEAPMRIKEEEELHKEPSITLLPPGWEELLRQQEEAKEIARHEAIVKEAQRLKDEEEAKLAAEKVQAELEAAALNDSAEAKLDEDGNPIEVETAGKKTDEENSAEEKKTEEPIAEGVAESKDEENKSEGGEDTPEEEKVVVIPVDRVRWMYENDEGWQLYNTFLSKELEEASRDGKGLYSITFHTDDDVNRTKDAITHKCNFETKTVLDNNGTNRKLRRHVISEGIASMWERFNMKYE